MSKLTNSSEYNPTRAKRHHERKATDPTYLEAKRKRGRDYYHRHKDKTRNKRIASKYGLTEEEYAQLLANGCQVCGSTTRLVVDHNHTTEQVRGCLCNGCNTALGLMRENANNIRSLAGYIEHHQTKTEK